MWVHEGGLRKGIGRNGVLEHLVLTDSSEIEVVGVALTRNGSIEVASNWGCD